MIGNKMSFSSWFSLTVAIGFLWFLGIQHDWLLTDCDFFQAPKSHLFDVYKVGPEPIVTNGGMWPLWMAYNGLINGYVTGDMTPISGVISTYLFLVGSHLVCIWLAYIRVDYITSLLVLFERYTWLLFEYRWTFVEEVIFVLSTLLVGWGIIVTPLLATSTNTEDKGVMIHLTSIGCVTIYAKVDQQNICEVFVLKNPMQFPHGTWNWWNIGGCSSNSRKYRLREIPYWRKNDHMVTRWLLACCWEVGVSLT